jgi:hypothetical protein
VRFRSQFTAWAAEVPAMVPRFLHCKPPPTAFNLWKVVTQECHGLFAIGASFFVLDTIRNAFQTNAFGVDRVRLIVFITTGLLFAAGTLAKKLAASRQPAASSPRIASSNSRRSCQSRFSAAGEVWRKRPFGLTPG